MAVEHWKTEPDEQDYPTAKSYLSLLVGVDAAGKLVKAMRKQDDVVRHAAKDLLRAARLPLLSSDDSEVLTDLAKIQRGSEALPGPARAGRSTVDRRWLPPGLCQLPRR